MFGTRNGAGCAEKLYVGHGKFWEGSKAIYLSFHRKAIVCVRTQDQSTVSVPPFWWNIYRDSSVLEIRDSVETCTGRFKSSVRFRTGKCGSEHHLWCNCVIHITLSYYFSYICDKRIFGTK